MIITWSSSLILFMIWVHVVGDFVLQPRCIATRKSTDSLYLVLHGLILLPFLCLIGKAGSLSWVSSLGYGLIVTFIHCIQDVLVWRAYHRYKKKDVEWQNDAVFWNWVGNDQALHISTYILVLFMFSRSSL